MIYKIKVEKVPIRLLVNFVGTAPTFLLHFNIWYTNEKYKPYIEQNKRFFPFIKNKKTVSISEIEIKTCAFLIFHVK